jgi:hypothetical protein
MDFIVFNQQQCFTLRAGEHLRERSDQQRVGIDIERAEAERGGVLEFHQRIIDTSSTFIGGL